jgi:polysaccharide export outer membrane protein
VVIFRTVEGKPMAARFDLAAIRTGAETDPEVYPSDVVVVDTSRNRRLVRDFAPLLPLISVFRLFVPY